MPVLFQPLFAVIALVAVLPVRPAEAATETTTILFLGDSLTEGHGVQRHEAFPARVHDLLEKRTGAAIEIINGGVSGSTTASGLDRLQWYARKEPDIVVLALGANDGLRGVRVEAAKANLLEIIDRAQALDMKVVLAGMMLPPNYGNAYTQRFSRMFAEIHEARDIAFIPFLLEGVAGEKALNLPDGIHPNAAGHRRIAQTVVEHLEQLL